MIIEAYKKGNKEQWLVDYNNARHYFYSMRELIKWLGTNKGDAK